MIIIIIIVIYSGELPTAGSTLVTTTPFVTTTVTTMKTSPSTFTSSTRASTLKASTLSSTTPTTKQTTPSSTTSRFTTKSTSSFVTTRATTRLTSKINPSQHSTSSYVQTELLNTETSTEWRRFPTSSSGIGQVIPDEKPTPKSKMKEKNGVNQLDDFSDAKSEVKLPTDKTTDSGDKLLKQLNSANSVSKTNNFYLLKKKRRM